MTRWLASVTVKPRRGFCSQHVGPPAHVSPGREGVVSACPPRSVLGPEGPRAPGIGRAGAQPVERLP